MSESSRIEYNAPALPLPDGVTRESEHIGTWIRDGQLLSCHVLVVETPSGRRAPSALIEGGNLEVARMMNYEHVGRVYGTKKLEGEG